MTNAATSSLNASEADFFRAMSGFKLSALSGSALNKSDALSRIERGNGGVSPPLEQAAFAGERDLSPDHGESAALNMGQQMIGQDQPPPAPRVARLPASVHDRTPLRLPSTTRTMWREVHFARV